MGYPTTGFGQDFFRLGALLDFVAQSDDLQKSSRKLDARYEEGHTGGLPGLRHCALWFGCGAEKL
jgi:hypothetical protein